MRIGVIGVGRFGAEELNPASLPPAWRKATRNMVMATYSAERAFQGLEKLREALPGEIGLVVGTNSGELETSAEFLITWSKQKMARPLLFQNSLHNATTGFMSIHFGLSGPSFTVSSAERTPGECVELAEQLLRSGLCKAVVVTLVEGHKSLAQMMGRTPVEGACTLVFADEALAALTGVRVIHSGVQEKIKSDYVVNPEDAPLYSVDASEFYQHAAL